MKKLYSASIDINKNNLLDEIFVFNIDFNINGYQIFLSYEKQFQMLVDLQKEKKLEISLSDEYLKNLCLSSIYFISSSQEKFNLDFLFNIFIYLYFFEKSKFNKDKLVKIFLDKVNINSIEPKFKDIKYKKDNKLNIDIYPEFEKSFSKIDSIQNDLIKIGGKENIEKIHILLAYYYLKYFPKKFVTFISSFGEYSKNIFENLTKNRKIFNNFNSEIIDYELINEAEDIQQIELLLKYLPNIVEFFKEFDNDQFFFKLSNLSLI